MFETISIVVVRLRQQRTIQTLCNARVPLAIARRQQRRVAARVVPNLVTPSDEGCNHSRISTSEALRGLPWAKWILLYQLFRVRRFPHVSSIRGVCFRSKVIPKSVKSIEFCDSFATGSERNRPLGKPISDLFACGAINSGATIELTSKPARRCHHSPPVDDVDGQESPAVASTSHHSPRPSRPARRGASKPRTLLQTTQPPVFSRPCRSAS